MVREVQQCNVISAAELYSYMWLKQCISYYVTFTTLKKFFLKIPPCLFMAS